MRKKGAGFVKQSYYRIEVLSRYDERAQAVADIRLIYVLDGQCELIGPSEHATLHKWDTVIINSMESTRLHFGEEDVVAVISLNYFTLCDFLKRSAIRFSLNSQSEGGQKYTQVRLQVQELLMAHVTHDAAGPCRELSCFFQLLYTLLSGFQVRGTEDEEGADGRVAAMIRYIYANYSTNLTLNEIAEQLYLSPSTASRLFRPRGRNSPFM